MPELPEVETVIRSIRLPLVGQRVSSSHIFWQRTLGGVSAAKFRKLVEGKEILRVTRRAKYILIELAPEGHLAIHLRMSGDLIVVPRSVPHEKHLRICLELENGTDLRFVDTRKFGRFIYYADIRALLDRLGPEPIDLIFDYDKFFRKLQSTGRMIKPLLLDQSILAGLGNIYVVESLWRARIHPLKRADQLSRKKVDQLIQIAATVLREAIEAQGTDLGDGVWKAGAFEPSTYGREGMPCLRCRSRIRKIRVAQRGTEFCARCQRQ